MCLHTQEPHDIGYNVVMKTNSTNILIVFVLFTCTTLATAQTLVDPSRFQAPRQPVYTLDAGDTIGVFVDGVVGEVNSMPPVRQPDPGSSLPPAIGFPTLVLHDGTIRLPFTDPISVRGLSVAQVESLLRKTYSQGDDPIITERSRVLTSLMRKRTVNVLVVRGDQSQSRAGNRFQTGNSRAVSARSDGSGQIFNLNLPVGENDILSAMVETGGLPGVNAQSQLQVFRSTPTTESARPSFPRTNQTSQTRHTVNSIAVRANGQTQSFPRSAARLNDGDIVAVAARPTEVFYTGGRLPGGEFAIPRDKSLSVLEAIALAGGIPQAQRSVGAIPLQQPQILTLLRKRGGQQVAYRFNLSNGFSQQAAATQVRSGDYLLLDFSPTQRVQNVGVGVFNTVGIRALLRN